MADNAQVGNKAGVTQEAQREDVTNTFFYKFVSDPKNKDKFIYEDDRAVAIHDINPQAPVHILVLPKNEYAIAGLSVARESDEAILGHLVYVATKVAAQQKLQSGYRLVVNEGTHGQQSVRYIHLHVLGGKQLSWPPG